MKYLLPVLALSLMTMSSLPAHAIDVTGKLGIDAQAGQAQVNTKAQAGADLAQASDPADPQAGINAQGSGDPELKTPDNNPALHQEGGVGAQAQREDGKKPNKNLSQLFQSFKKDGASASADGNASTNVNTSTQPR